MFSHVCGETNHKFKPRYNTIPPDMSNLKRDDFLYEDNWLAAMNIMTAEQYVCDVCVYCGKTTNTFALNANR